MRYQLSEDQAPKLANWKVGDRERESERERGGHWGEASRHAVTQ